MENRTPGKEATVPAAFRTLYEDMIAGLELLQVQNEDTGLTTAKKCIQHIRLSIAGLKEQVSLTVFTRKEEITFFKQVKPLFHRHLIFWIGVFNIELLRPVGGRKAVEKYLRKQLEKLHHFFISNSGFYIYVRSGDTLMDDIYFARDKMDDYAANPHCVDSDRSFTTSHDYLVARILANEMLQDYLNREISFLGENPTALPASSQVFPLQWTASKAGLVELIYALQSGGVYNNGNAEIKEIADCFGKLFQIDLGNYYHTFNEIRLRKKSRTQLLDQLKEKVVKKMDEMDER